MSRRSRLALISIAGFATLVGSLLAGPVRGDTPPRILFGLGPTVDSARSAPLVRDAPVNMLSVWYNGPHDLGWLTDAYHRSMYRSVYDDGKALHLIVHVNGPEKRFSTNYGTACGRRYPMTARFRDDMRRLAKALGAQSGPSLYVTLFTEFQTYPCVDNAYRPNAQVRRYYRALKDRYAVAQRIFRQEAPNALVSIGWGGWQMRWDDPDTYGGRSMFSRFATLMRRSDFVSFQAMSGTGNVSDIRRMTRRLGRYGPVMLAHYKPEGGDAGGTFDSDMRKLLTYDSLAWLTDRGLFSIGFMDHAILSDRPATYRYVRDKVNKFAAGPLALGAPQG